MKNINCEKPQNNIFQFKAFQCSQERRPGYTGAEISNKRFPRTDFLALNVQPIEDLPYKLTPRAMLLIKQIRLKSEPFEPNLFLRRN